MDNPSSPYEWPSGDYLLAGAAKFLIEGGQKDAASVLLGCSTLDVIAEEELFSLDDLDSTVQVVSVTLHGPRWVYDLITGDGESSKRTRDGITNALRAYAPERYHVRGIWARAELPPLGPNWRAELEAAARDKTVHNQAATAERVIVWKGLRFRSHTEVRIADALDQA
jgi:hypothetical protein